MAQARIARTIKTFAKAGEVLQVPITHRTNHLAFTSALSNKRAKNKDCPATIPNPNNMINQDQDQDLARQ